MKERYSRNIGALTRSEQARVRKGRVLIAGCGGLGGYLAELLARIGVGTLTLADGDVFEANNLNRQLMSTPALLGQSKARTAAERVREVNPDVKVCPVEEFLTPENTQELVAGHDLALDALDSVEARRLLAAACAGEGIPLVHGAVSGWNIQVSTILPGSDTLERLYTSGGTASKTVLSFTPCVCAGMQAAEAVRILSGQPPELAGKVLFGDLRTMEWHTVVL